MQWGGWRTLEPDGAPSSHAAATFLSTLCRELEVDIVGDWSNGFSEYWGNIAHFKIGAMACELLSDPKLKRLMGANRDRIGFSDERLTEGTQFSVGKNEYVPLADVPDYVWSQWNNEGPQHFADIDLPEAGSGARELPGKTLHRQSLLARCRDDPRQLSADVWLRYFASFKDEEWGPEEGCLPFRVWQVYQEGVAALKRSDAARFVTAMGVLAHYVADCSNPLHLSVLHHGEEVALLRKPPKAERDDDENPYNKAKKKPAARIHKFYESNMVARFAEPLLTRVNDRLKGVSARPLAGGGGHRAAVRAVELMVATYEALPPRAILEADDPERPQKRSQVLWEALGDRTVVLLANACRALAEIWETAWQEASQAERDRLAEGAISEDALQEVYREDREFLRPLSLAGYRDAGFTVA